MRGQSLNRAAILTTLNIIFRRPGLLVPHVSVPHLGDLDFLSLKASGVEYVVLDKDNTLTAPYDDDAPPHPLVAAAAQSAVDIFGAEKSPAVQLRWQRRRRGLRRGRGLRGGAGSEGRAPPDGEEAAVPAGASPLGATTRAPPLPATATTDVLFANLHGALSVHTAP
ncbi:phosphatase [Aureococcus anophagefferens]|nr:phosphatase [Aureococcus anophagefferens]